MSVFVGYCSSKFAPDIELFSGCDENKYSFFGYLLKILVIDQK